MIWNRRTTSKILSGCLVILLLLALARAVRAGGGAPTIGIPTAWLSPSRIDPDLQDRLDRMNAGDTISVIVHLSDQADLHLGAGRARAQRLSSVVQALQRKAQSSQASLLALIRSLHAQTQIVSFRSFWIFNGFEVTGTRQAIETLAGRPEVARIAYNATLQAPEFDLATAGVEANLSLVGVEALWAAGYRGEGIVVASMDTGVYLDHPDLASRWRGGSNSWFDPNGQHPFTPFDANGHGTWTMGVMVGGDAGGTAIGLAPGAQWIAVKIFDDSGSATLAAIHAGYQWLLDPDGNPATADAPHVVNNSWTFSGSGCNLEFEGDLQALRAAGILPVFAAGNSGPWSGTSRSPANNPSAFAVGASNNSDGLFFYSARGPSSCPGGAPVYPHLVAPGVNIRTTDLYGLYRTATGTSLAAPHVAGGLALLLDAFPELTADQQASALINSAVDLGDPGPDNSYGYGRLDLYAAYQWLLANRTEVTATPTNAPTATFTPTAEPAFSPTPTATTVVPSATPTETLTPTSTSTPTLAPTATASPQPSPTLTASPTPSPTQPPTATATPQPSPTQTATSQPSPTLTASPTPSPTQPPTATPTALPGEVNLALHKPVTVSSFQDASHSGAQAVDGDSLTFWKTARASRSSPVAEWIVVDLGEPFEFDRIELEWDQYFGIAYRLEISADSLTWNSLVTVSKGDGGMDVYAFSPVNARYVRLYTTAWNNWRNRNWLRELRVLGTIGGGQTGGSPSPTPTLTVPTATFTPTPSPTGVPPSATPSPTLLPSPTPTPGAGSGMHVGDLDGSVKTGGAYWAARVTVAVHNGSEAPLSGVLVSGTWGGSYGSGACTTGDAGRCTISLFSLPSDLTSITFTVTGLSLSGQTYIPSANHDPDGDSDGTVIVISR